MENRRQKTEDRRLIKLGLLPRKNSCGNSRGRRCLVALVMTPFLLAICFLSNAYANNLAITKVALIGQGGAGTKVVTGNTTATISFSLAQDNSWNYSPQLHDAAWVFVKYSVADSNGVMQPWKHATITAVDMNAITGSPLISAFPITNNLNKGVFIYRAAEGSGRINTSGIKLTWDIVTDGAVAIITAPQIILKVFALEMVRIPQGAFYVGDGTTTNVTGQLGAGTSTLPYKITSEGALTLGGVSGNIGNNDGYGMTYVDDFNNNVQKNLSDNTSGSGFPKGYNAFYCMKYELTQGQYRDFLNTLTRAQQGKRVASDISADAPASNLVYVMSGTAAPTGVTIPAYRNGIRCLASGNGTTKPITFYCDLNNNNIPNEATDGEFIACDYLSWPDMAAYADWAALRPMTELEFEKAARGTAIPVADEYAWGTTDIQPATGITNPGAANEIAANSTANCVTGSIVNVQGPMRSGALATLTSTNRKSSGASFYGVMDLSGNLSESVIALGISGGRSFTGLHGDGVLNAIVGSVGDANVSFWPGSATPGLGFRGGVWDFPLSFSRVSDRNRASQTSYGRSSYIGCRLVRTE